MGATLCSDDRTTHTVTKGDSFDMLSPMEAIDDCTTPKKRGSSVGSPTSDVSRNVPKHNNEESIGSLPKVVALQTPAEEIEPTEWPLPEPDLPQRQNAYLGGSRDHEGEDSPPDSPPAVNAGEQRRGRPAPANTQTNTDPRTTSVRTPRPITQNEKQTEKKVTEPSEPYQSEDCKDVGKPKTLKKDWSTIDSNTKFNVRVQNARHVRPKDDSMEHTYHGYISTEEPATPQPTTNQIDQKTIQTEAPPKEDEQKSYAYSFF